MGGNTKLHIGNLKIDGFGIIDWVGGEVGKANILWIDSLSLLSGTTSLYMRNWYEHEDIFLVRKTGFNPADVSIISFEGYQTQKITYRDWDADFYQITPFGHLAMPEPSTYGALLGALGTGLYLLRHKRQKGRRTSECAVLFFVPRTISKLD